MHDSTWRSTAPFFGCGCFCAEAGRLLAALALGGAGGFVSDAKVTLRALLADPAPATTEAFVLTPEAALTLPAAGVADGLSAGATWHWWLWRFGEWKSLNFTSGCAGQKDPWL